MIEKLVEIGYLFDFYGKLLSDRQYSVIEMFYLDDLSLSEIGELLGITRQSVYDTLKRAEENLYEYEENLRLGEKFNKRNKNFKEILDLIIEIRELEPNNQEIQEKSSEIESILRNILKDSWEGVE